MDSQRLCHRPKTAPIHLVLFCILDRHTQHTAFESKPKIYVNIANSRKIGKKIAKSLALYFLQCAENLFITFLSVIVILNAIILIIQSFKYEKFVEKQINQSIDQKLFDSKSDSANKLCRESFSFLYFKIKKSTTSNPLKIN